MRICFDRLLAITDYSSHGSPGKTGYSKWGTSGGVRKFGPAPPPPPPLCTTAQFAKCAPACAADADTPVCPARPVCYDNPYKVW
jgi:hypothetical protein